MQTTLLLDHAPTGDRASHVVRALLTLRGDAPAASERPPLNLALVLDRSGSMEGEPLAAAKHAASQLVRRLLARDAVSVVAYDDQVRTVAAQAMGDAHRAAAAAIDHIGAGGCTNLSGGWLRGRELVAHALRDGGTNRVVLLTDGLANAGITQPATLVALCAEARTRGVTTTTIGFGPGYDETLLRAMADGGGGNTYFVERVDQARSVFDEELTGLASLAAQNVAVEIRPGAAVEVLRVHHDYPGSVLADGVRLELGDLYASEPKALLVELLVAHAADAPAGVDRVLATIVVQGHVITSAGGVERREVALRVATSLDGDAHVEPEIRREMLLLSAARARQSAIEARDRGDYDGGAAALHEAAASLDALAPQLGDVELADEAADLRRMAGSFIREDVSPADAKYLAQMAYATHRKRRGSKDLLRRMK